MASVPSGNSEDTSCDKCRAPASCADSSMSNLSWKQSLSHHLETYLLSPRMWPIGYIVRSPYSPFRLEKEMPAHQSWRDAFEDLLALESGGQMIDRESRNREAQIAKRVYQEIIAHDVSDINDRLKSNAKHISLFNRAEKTFPFKDFAKNDGWMGEAIKLYKQHSKFLIATGREKIAALKQQIDQNWPASKYKGRGQWMASLISSGALPGWRAQIFNSSEGPQVDLTKIEGDLDDPDGQMMTEGELTREFDEGIPMQLGHPVWSTSAGQYPESFREDYTDGEVTKYVEFQATTLRPSILSQIIAAECTKSEKGIISTKVALKNLFTDGTTESKEIIDDPSKVLEETEKVYSSMQTRNVAVDLATEEARYDMMVKQVDAYNENELD